MAPRPIVAVACSGGRDSIALLHATCRAAASLGVDVLALHVHHGLQPEADDWLTWLAATCRRWARRGVPLHFKATRLRGAPARGESVEAWARRERYAALATMAQASGADTVLLAHHRRDQAETWLLQVLRGAGTAGQSAMPARIERDGVIWLRPWLDRSSDAIDAYVRRHRLRHVTDGSNADPHLARNRLRLAVWPALIDAFPQAELSLARAAGWAQEAQAVLDEVAAQDLSAATDAARGIDLQRWRALTPARRSLALRTWLRALTGEPAPVQLIERLLVELDGDTAARWAIGGGWLHRHRGRLCHEGAPEGPAILDPSAVQSPMTQTVELRFDEAASHKVSLPGGVLEVEPCASGGLAVPVTLTLRARAGGERYQAGPSRPPRDLKRQFQAAGVPSWRRGAPLLYIGTQLAFVPGLGLDARCIAAPGVPQVLLRWRDAGPGTSTT